MIVMNWILAVVFVFAMLGWFVTAKRYKKFEYIVKPATMIVLITWVEMSMMATNTISNNLNWFVVGLVLCLFGDIFLMLPPEKWFMPGLVAFLLGQVAYIFGFRVTSIVDGTMIPTILLIFLLIIVGEGVFRRIRAGLIESNREKLILPVGVYSIVISYMVISAAYSFLNPAWTTTQAYLVTFGALFFYISDVLNAWDRFVFSFGSARLIIMVTYHLGQVGLAVGATLHFLG
jgi:uncharacterized membrane protein YhhN